MIEVVINVEVRARCSSECFDSQLQLFARLVTPVSQNNPSAVTAVVTALRYVSPTRSLRGSLFYEAIQGRDKIYGFLFTELCELELDAVVVQSVACAVEDSTNDLQFLIHFF